MPQTAQLLQFVMKVRQLIFYPPKRDIALLAPPNISESRRKQGVLSPKRMIANDRHG